MITTTYFKKTNVDIIHHIKVDFGFLWPCPPKMQNCYAEGIRLVDVLYKSHSFKSTLQEQDVLGGLFFNYVLRQQNNTINLAFRN